MARTRDSISDDESATRDDAVAHAPTLATEIVQEMAGAAELPPLEPLSETVVHVGEPLPANFRRPAISGLVSLVAHFTLVISLALWWLPGEEPVHLWIVANFTEPDDNEPKTTPELLLSTMPQPADHDEAPTESSAAGPVEIELRASAATDSREKAVGLERLIPDGLLAPLGAPGGGLTGRRPEHRARLVAMRGGNQASEEAVYHGLRWLVNHQLEDGSWRLNHQLAPGCRERCSHPGNVGSSTAATALALLPFLGAGSTHKEGEFREVVQKGLYYLAGRMKLTKQGGDLQEGTMYAQGLATIVLCEAYAMSRDEALRPFAQAALDFIVHAQHPGGGWRYLPGQPGDTTSLAWQLMALKSGHMAGLSVPSPTIMGVERFLDSVQTPDRAGYGYQKPERRPGTTAIGLLCRMYLGWDREFEPIRVGADWLSERGPSETDVYYNYYATQVLHHYEGPHWDAWNERLRDYLIQTQSRTGHESGSWHFPDQHGEKGGRLYTTAMAVMTLEVYYRYLPLYRSVVLEDTW